MKHITKSYSIEKIIALGLILFCPIWAGAASISSVTVAEGVGQATFTVTLDPADFSGKNLSVKVSTSDGSALSGQDYTATSKTLNFSPNQTSVQTFDVPIIDDAITESDEAFNVTVRLKNKIIATGTGTIQDNDGGNSNQPPVCIIDTPASDITIPAGNVVNFTSTLTDPNNDPLNIDWVFDGGSPSNSTLEDPGQVIYNTAGTYTATLNAGDGKGGNCPAQSRTVTVRQMPAVSINSTSARSSAPVTDPVPEQPIVANSAYRVLAANDLGMHCTDLDARVASILPPFQVLLAQVIQKGNASKPILNPLGIDLFYSAASNPFDPVLTKSGIFNGLTSDGTTYKTNFWSDLGGGNVLANVVYDPFYPSGVLPILSQDLGLLVPNVENLYIGADGIIDIAGGSQDGELTAVQHATPGLSAPYVDNVPQRVNEFYWNKPMFVNFPFGYVSQALNVYEGGGIPLAPFDDFGRENPFPLFRIQAKAGDTVLSTTDAVLPVSAEASCITCHLGPDDGVDLRSQMPTQTLLSANLPVAASGDDPDDKMPMPVSQEYAADINILRLHDLKHGANYVNTSNVNTACTINQANPNGGPTCLINLALVQNKPVICQTCHYTPALDLAHVGPMAGAPGTDANGRNQLAHQSNSRVMHNHHGQFSDLFTPIPEAIQDANGVITNQAARVEALNNNCYQCHPGKNTKCLRGAMYNGGILCSDCHGSMEQVGDDFSKNVSPSDPGAFIMTNDFYAYPDTGEPSPRVPWANEPGCGSCHTGDSVNNLANSANVLVNNKDSKGNVDGIRLRQAFRIGDPKATPIVPTNKTFAEPAAPASFNGFDNPGAGNPMLYRVSTGHGGVMCEGCHGSTHAEWPVADPNANDNVTANQIQGHTGPITECTACHTTSALPANTQGGPHGMHLVNDSRFWREAHKEAAKIENKKGGGSCATCHGSDHLGTVLSRVPATRTFLGRQVEAGRPVACNLCHSLSKSFGQ